MNDWDRRAARSGLGLFSIGITSILATGFIFSPYLWYRLALDPTKLDEPWRWLGYIAVFEPSEYGYLTFSILLVVSFFFLRHAELNLGRIRLLLTMGLGVLAGAAVYTLVQRLIGSRESIGGESMPALASVLAMISFVASRKTCLYFFLIPMNVRLAAFFTLLLFFLHTAAQTRSAAALLPLGASTVVGVLILQSVPFLEHLSRRTREQAERRRLENEVSTRHRVDEILAKIHVSGMESLTRDELRVLKKASRQLAEQRVER